ASAAAPFVSPGSLGSLEPFGPLWSGDSLESLALPTSHSLHVAPALAVPLLAPPRQRRSQPRSSVRTGGKITRSASAAAVPRNAARLRSQRVPHGCARAWDR